jgi:hypothetical protein
MRTSTRALSIALLFAVSLSAQGQPRRATNLLMLVAQPGFFHQRPVVVVGDITLQNSGSLRIAADGSSLPLLTKNGAPEGLNEVRGEFWDVGRMNADDPRLTPYDLRRTLGIDPEATWPRPGVALALVVSSTQPASTPAAPSIRNIVLYPSRYLDQTVTITGQFSGRNLLGELPDSPAQSRYDFVLRSADAAIWVSNLRPRGRDFELSLDARIDTTRWLEVTGRVQQARGLQWIDGEAGSLKLTTAPAEVTEETQTIRVPAAPPPEVVFSAPIEDDVDVALSSSVRIQFSRDIDPATIRNHVRASYATQASGAAAAVEPPLEITTQYLPGTRVLEVRFAEPLERFRTVKVELIEGILGTDKQPLAPWTLRFTTGS